MIFSDNRLGRHNKVLDAVSINIKFPDKCCFGKLHLNSTSKTFITKNDECHHMKRMKHMMMKYVTQGKFKLMAGYNIFSDKKLDKFSPVRS